MEGGLAGGILTELAQAMRCQLGLAIHPELLQQQLPVVVVTQLEIKNDEGRHEFLDLTHICKENERQVNLRAFLSNMSGQ
jgi:hypothetical protein